MPPAKPTKHNDQHVILIPLSKLMAWDRNPRAHPEENISGIMGSIRRFGLVRKPVLATWPRQKEKQGVIIAGNGVLTALTRLHEADAGHPPPGVDMEGGEWMIAVTPTRFVSKLEAEAYGMADNWHNESSHDDQARVALVLLDLEVANFDMSVLGKPDEEIAALLELAHAGQGSAIPEPEAGEGSGSDGNGEKVTSEGIAKYTLIFDSESQLDRWYRFLTWLKKRYPDAESIGERVHAFIQESEHD